MTNPSGEITELLQEWKDGGQYAGAKVFEALMPELKRIATRCFVSERNAYTLQPTVLVNEAFLRLAAAKNIEWHDRGHFLSLAARIMRRFLIDRARSRGSANIVPMEGLPERVLAGHEPVEAATILDSLLNELDLESRQQRAVVELKFFLGMTDSEAAAALGLSLHTFQREWYRARRWLFERLTA